MSVLVRPLRFGDLDAWRTLRVALWPDCGPDCERELGAMLDAPATFMAFCADADGMLVGFAELSVRSIVDGATQSPCGFLEGWYVDPAHRCRGIGRALVAAGERWLQAQGIGEIGSDALLDNASSHATHAAIGFVEVDRVVRFVKRL